MAHAQHDFLGEHWILIDKVIAHTGYSDDAIRAKVRRKDWARPALWRKAPDGRLVFNLTRIQSWMSGDPLPVGHWAVLAAVVQCTGYSADAIRKKIRRGQWTCGKFWRKSPDGRIAFDLTRIQAWMSSGE